MEPTQAHVLTGRQRLLTALAHQEPDRIPLDLGSTQVTGIHMVAYKKLRTALGLPTVDSQVYDTIQGLVVPDPDLLERLGVDVRGMNPRNSHNWQVLETEVQDENSGELYWSYHDEWGIAHRKPRPDGLYYSLYQAPLDKPELTAEEIRKYPWPNLADPMRIAGLREKAEDFHAAGYAVVLKDPFAGIFEMAQRIVGMENLLVMMGLDKPLAAALFAKLVELKLSFWEMAGPQLADVVDVISRAEHEAQEESRRR